MNMDKSGKALVNKVQSMRIGESKWAIDKLVPPMGWNTGMFNHPRINRGGGRRKAEYNSQSTTSIC